MTSSPPDTVSEVLDAIDAGEAGAVDELFEIVYSELRVGARQQRHRWRGNHTLNTTALVHEVYLKLIGQSGAGWNSRAHFLAAAAKAMRHLLIDYARKQNRQKRGGDRDRVGLDDVEHKLAADPDPTMTDAQAHDMLALNKAMQRLARINERQSQVVECRFFGGMTIPQTAEVLRISPATVKRDWRLAQAWLYHDIKQATER